MRYRDELARLARLLTPLADLVLPRECAGCGAPDRTLCPACAAALAGPAVHPPLEAAQRALLTALPVATCGRYRGVLAAVVHAWKDGGRRDLTGVLAAPLARAVAAAADAAGVLGGPGPRRVPDLLLVPVPTSPAAVRRRGADLVADLAAGAARLLSAGAAGSSAGVRWRAAPVLGRCRRTADQAGLDLPGRVANVHGAFTATRRPARPGEFGCVVVDDVLTSAASAGEAVRALRAGGWPTLAVATVCATPRRTPSTT